MLFRRQSIHPLPSKWGLSAVHRLEVDTQCTFQGLKLNGYKPPQNKTTRKCRHCTFEWETLPHVINHCRPLLPRITERHNKIVKRIKEAASSRWEVISENRYVNGTSLKPDLVLARCDQALIIDVACPFDEGIEKFNNTRSEKIEKYRPLINTHSYKYKSISVDAVIVGSLGSWDPKNDRILTRVCTRKYLKLMKKLIVSETIRSSRDIFYEHAYGVPQEDYRSSKNRSRGRRNIIQSNSSLPPVGPADNHCSVDDLLASANELTSIPPIPQAGIPLSNIEEDYSAEDLSHSQEIINFADNSNLCLDNNFPAFDSVGTQCGHRYCKDSFCKHNKKHPYAVVSLQARSVCSTYD